MQELLSYAAGDFHAARTPSPAGFRDVRLGHVMHPSGAKQYMLCGQFLPGGASGEGEWQPFATIKTDPYEQWLGLQAAGLCQQSAITWVETEDLSPSLQSQLDSLK